LLAFRLGRLGETEGTEVRAHLAGCPACQAMAEALNPQTLSAMLASTSAETPTGTGASESATLAPAARAPAPPALPAELADHPRYRVLKLLGVGGMGSVYQAEHRLMERPVALKTISRHLTEDSAAVERFQREMRTAARLAHPNIVTAHDAEQAHGLHFLVMEYVDGMSLDRVVAQRGPLPAGEAASYIRQAALGLQHAHERGMVHRDIKPHNLMRDRDGHVKILDFGLARFFSESKPVTALTQTGTVMGTPDYIAPEQARDARAADVRSDIYSLGCTFYFLLTGRPPFADGSVLQKLMAHVERAPRPLTEIRGDIPAALARVVERMMAKDPAHRFQTPGEVAAALSAFAAGPPPGSGVGAATAPTPTLDPAPWAGRPVPVARFAAPPRRASYLGNVRRLSTLSLMLGLVAIPVSCIPGIGVLTSGAGLLLGVAAVVMARRRQERRPGTAVTGIVLNAVALACAYGFQEPERKRRREDAIHSIERLIPHPTVPADNDDS
jgi:hypothetical protein